MVGPNGSGKSNVVDAVRWILGEQSAKSLRGGEMADVIFNGSSSRKSLGMAEVTIAFDNARRLLKLDADEVQLTRRVYRDGTGEYLINGQMARLRDIKEMLLGSGKPVARRWYTIIARRAVSMSCCKRPAKKDRAGEIFDEAAGISRFKAKKTETLRKLAAVELNLTRLEGQARRPQRSAPASLRVTGDEGQAVQGVQLLSNCGASARRIGGARVPATSRAAARGGAVVRARRG